MRGTKFGAGKAALLSSVALGAAMLAQGALAGEISGTVIDSTGTAFLQGASIEILELGRTAQAGDNGAYRFADVPAGSYTLRATYAGAQTSQVQVTVANSGDMAISDFILGPQGTEVASLLIIGQQANQASAIQRQRSADGVSSILTRDAIGQFPDQNVAESIRRLPGVNILNDQGEGRFVAIRGLDPDLNAASIDGVRTPAPESDVRSVALDVISSDLIESIEIRKTLTPQDDADTIGGVIEINTTSAFERSGTFFGARVEGSYNDLNGEWSPKAGAEFSTLVTDRFGIAGGISYYNRSFSTDNIEADDWDSEGGILFPEEIQYRDYDVERTRLSANLSFDFDVSDSTDLYVRMLHSVFEDQEYRGRVTLINDGPPIAGNAFSSTFLSQEEVGDDDDPDYIPETVLGVERDIKDRYEEQAITSIVFGGETNVGPWDFRYSASFAKASEEENGSLDPTQFEREFEDTGELGWTIDYGDWRRPMVTLNQGQSLFLDPDEYELNDIERTTLSLAEDRENAFQFDGSREFGLQQGAFRLGFGAKLRMREKEYNKTVDFFEYDGPGDYLLSDVLGQATYGLADIDPVPSPSAARQFFTDNIGLFEHQGADSDFDSAVEDYRVEEDISAFYLLGDYQSGPLQVIGGLRFEQTEQTLWGNQVDLYEEDSTLPGGATATDDTVIVTPVMYQREYDDLFPSLLIRYDATENVVLRGGVFRSIVRPKPGQMAPRFAVETNDDNEVEGEFGNPDLLPYEAWNFDFSAEWYFAPNAVFSAGVFHKSIDNYIAEREFQNDSFNGIAFDEAVIPINLEDATVTGLELNYQHAFTNLPGAWSGLLAGVNYTYTDSEGLVDDGGSTRAIPLPASAQNTLNLMVGYERGPWSLRLSGAYRDEYLDEVGGDADTDRYVEDHFQWDFVGKYRVNENVQIFGEFINMTDEPYVAFQHGPSGPQLLQYEEYSWTAKFGVRLTR